MNRAVVLVVVEKRVVDDRATTTRAAVKALAPNEEIIPMMIKREKARKQCCRADEKAPIEISNQIYEVMYVRL